MITSTVEGQGNVQPQSPPQKPKSPQKVTVAAKKGQAAASKARSARKPRSAKKGGAAIHHGHRGRGSHCSRTHSHARPFLRGSPQRRLTCQLYNRSSQSRRLLNLSSTTGLVWMQTRWSQLPRNDAILAHDSYMTARYRFTNKIFSANLDRGILAC